MSVRTWRMLGAGALLAVSAQAAAQNRMAGSGIRVTKDNATVSSTASVTPSNPTITTNLVGGEVSLATPFDLSAYGNVSEPNIAAHLLSGDSLEIQQAQLAQTKAMDPRVRDYATTLFNDHSAHLASTLTLIAKEHVGSTPMLNDPESLRMREFLTQMRNTGGGTNWDAAFLRFQAAHHQHEIDILNAVIKSAHDDDFEDHIDDTLKALAKHRDMARSLATTLGVSLP